MPRNHRGVGNIAIFTPKNYFRPYTKFFETPKNVSGAKIAQREDYNQSDLESAGIKFSAPRPRCSACETLPDLVVKHGGNAVGFSGRTFRNLKNVAEAIEKKANVSEWQFYNQTHIKRLEDRQIAIGGGLWRRLQCRQPINHRTQGRKLHAQDRKFVRNMWKIS